MHLKNASNKYGVDSKLHQEGILISYQQKMTNKTLGNILTESQGGKKINK